MHTLCAAYAPGNTDLAWTRLTPWRALLASALDQYELPVTSATVTAERISPSADLMAVWLRERLKVRVERKSSQRPGHHRDRDGDQEGPDPDQPHGRQAGHDLLPDRPDRPIALKRLEIPALLAEELRRLDEDDVYADVAKAFAKKRLVVNDAPFASHRGARGRRRPGDGRGR